MDNTDTLADRVEHAELLERKFRHLFGEAEARHQGAELAYRAVYDAVYNSVDLDTTNDSEILHHFACKAAADAVTPLWQEREKAAEKYQEHKDALIDLRNQLQSSPSDKSVNTWLPFVGATTSSQNP